MDPLAFSFRSSPRTSALAVVERGTALGSSPSGQRAHTYTHTPFSQRPGITWTSCSPFTGFPFGSPNPKYPPPDHPGGAGSCTIGRNPILRTEVHFSRSHSCVLYPRHTTHLPAFALPFTLAKTIALYPSYTPVFASFRILLSDFMVQRNSVICI